MAQVSMIETRATFTFAYKEDENGEPDKEIIELFIPRDELNAAHNYLCCCLFASQTAEKHTDPVKLSDNEFTAVFITQLLLGMLASIFGSEDGGHQLEKHMRIAGLIFPIPAPIAGYVMSWLKRCVAHTVRAEIKGMVMVALVNDRTDEEGIGVIDEIVHVADGGIKIIDNTDTDENPSEATETPPWFSK